jgi:hypothetical protein
MSETTKDQLEFEQNCDNLDCSYYDFDRSNGCKQNGEKCLYQTLKATIASKDEEIARLKDSIRNYWKFELDEKDEQIASKDEEIREFERLVLALRDNFTHIEHNSNLGMLDGKSVQFMRERLAEINRTCDSLFMPCNSNYVCFQYKERNNFDNCSDVGCFKYALLRLLAKEDK